MIILYQWNTQILPTVWLRGNKFNFLGKISWNHLGFELSTIIQTIIEQCASHSKPTSLVHKLSSTMAGPISYNYKAVLSHSKHWRVSILFNKINFNLGLAKEKDVGTPV